MKPIQFLFHTFTLLLLLTLISQPMVMAQKGKEKTQAQQDDDLIKQYLKKNKLSKKFKKTETGLYYHIEQKGQGKQADANSKLKVHYKGTLLDGTVFDSSYDRGRPIEFTLNMVVKGWREGLVMFSEGTKGTLLIPSELAYGQRAMGDKIQANAVLRFDLELLEVMENTPPEEKQAIKPASGQEQETVIRAYLDNSDLKGKAQKTESGLYYYIETEGAGKQPDINSTVTVHYKGTLLDGTKFDSSYDRSEPISFPLQGVIKGWQEGIPYFKEGGKGTLIIPAALAYGSKAIGPIPANSVLRFDIELLEVK